VIDDGSTDGTEAAVMEMLKKDLTTIEHGGRCENRKLGKAEGRATDSWPQGGAASGTMQVIEQPKVGPKGEEAGASESKGEAGLTTDFTDGHGYSAGLRPGSRAGTEFSNSSPSELTQDSENTSLIRSADGPASLPATRHSPPVTTGSPVLRLIRHEVSAGYIVRRNEGARLAKGDVIFSLDDDAVFSSPFVVEQTLRDFSHPRIGAVAIPYIEPHKANKEMQRAPTREDVWITASYIGTAHAVRRDVFLALGGYREHLVHQGEEGDFCLRMLAAEHEGKEILTTEDTESTEDEAVLTTIEHGGRREKDQPKVGPKGEEAGASESKGEAGLTTDYPEVPGFFVRLGNSDPIIHNESPKRDYSRMDFYGRRNDVLFHWQNTPMPDLLWQLPMTIAGGLLCAYRVKRWRKMLEGIGAGFLSIASGEERKPVSMTIAGEFKLLKQAKRKLSI
jgi:glycosyltransferase involved in cell wall biosynthesis